MKITKEEFLRLLDQHEDTGGWRAVMSLFNAIQHDLFARYGLSAAGGQPPEAVAVNEKLFAWLDEWCKGRSKKPK